MNKTFVLSDTHFNHVNILKYCPNRKYLSLHEMNEDILHRWNTVVGTEDTIYFLGDFAMGPKDQHLLFLSQLNGNIKIVPGNHDGYLKKLAKTGGLPPRVEMLEPIYNLKYKHMYFVLCHFPLDEWEGMAGHSSDHISGSIHLHGHTHGHSKYKPGRWDVGFDVYNSPTSIETFIP